MLGSGSACHIIGRESLSADDAVYTAPQSVMLATANGELMADKALDISPPGLRSHNLKALVLDQSPTVLSLGRLCMDHECDLVWKRGELLRL